MNVYNILDPRGYFCQVSGEKSLTVPDSSQFTP